MKRQCAIFLVTLVAGCAANSRAALAPGSAYFEIVERNVFGLKPTLQKEPERIPERPRGKVLLTGLTTILGDARVLVKVVPPPARAGEPLQKDNSYVLKKGEPENGIEVVDVDLKALTVTIRNSGLIEVLSFERNGVSLVSPPAPPPPPGVLGRGFAMAR